jgi:hypothetical protein
MGRPAKYFTHAERVAAQRRWRIRYAHSDRYIVWSFVLSTVEVEGTFSSGKAARSRRNQAAYQRAHGRQGSATLYIPRRLLAMAVDPLPSSYIFNEALLNPDALDESELNQWDQEPPYPCQMKLSGESTQYMANLIDVMHGRRLRQARHQEDARIARVKAGDIGGVRESIRGEIEDALSTWKRLMSGYVSLHCECDLMEGSCKESQMARHWMQWQARTVYYLHEDLKALNRGVHVFIANVISRRSS